MISRGVRRTPTEWKSESVPYGRSSLRTCVGARDVCSSNKLAKLGDAIAISKSETIIHPLPGVGARNGCSSKKGNHPHPAPTGAAFAADSGLSSYRHSTTHRPHSSASSTTQKWNRMQWLQNNLFGQRATSSVIQNHHRLTAVYVFFVFRCICSFCKIFTTILVNTRPLLYSHHIQVSVLIP